VDREPRGLCECVGQDGGSPRWRGIGEAAKWLSVVGLDGGEVLATAGGESTYFVQPEERGKEGRDMPRRRKEGRIAQWWLSPEAAGAVARCPNLTRSVGSVAQNGPNQGGGK
jgi:hypothetical protein